VYSVLLHFLVGETLHEIKNEAYTTTSEPACDSNSRPRVRTDCDKEFATECALKRHSETHSDKMYSCAECKKWFSNEKYLNMHMNIHSNRFKCSECGKSFSSRNALTRHRRIHSGEKPFECSVCGKRFRMAGDVTSHNRIHSGEKPYKCRVCDKRSVWISNHSHENPHWRKTVQVFSV